MPQTTSATAPSELGVTHPLDMLTAAEIAAARRILDEAGLLGPRTRFPRVLPVEPPKSVVQRHVAGEDRFDRSLDVTLLDTDTGHTRRLERCRRALEDPVSAGVPVARIATRWGFPDAAHFSRVFKAAYGVSPSEARARALAG